MARSMMSGDDGRKGGDLKKIYVKPSCSFLTTLYQQYVNTESYNER